MGTPTLEQKTSSRTVEPLENRIVPATVTWDGGGNGSSWHDAANWSGDVVPQPGDDVIINPAGDVTVIFSTGALTLNSLTMLGDDNLSLTGGSLALTGASTIHDLALSGNTTLSSGTLVTLTGSGSLAQANLNGPGVFEVAGTLALTGNEPDLRTELRVTGTFTHGNGYLDFDGGTAKIRVLAGGVYKTVNDQSDWGFRQFNGGTGITIEAGGTFRHEPANDARFLTNVGNNVPFRVDGGTVEVLSGTLGVNSQGLLSAATINVASGKALTFLNGASITVKGAITGAGAGTVNLSEGSVFAIDAAGATFNFLDEQFRMSGNATIAGPGKLTNAGFMRVAANEPNLETELINSGTIKHGNAYLDFNAAAAKLRIVQGGIYVTETTQGDWGMRQFNGGQGIFVEPGGTFRHASPNGVRFLTNVGNGVSFNVDGGTIDLVGGTLGINSPGTFNDVSINVAAGAALHFLSSATITAQGSIVGTGSGSVALRESGLIAATAAGLTLNFPAGMFSFHDSAALAGPGTITNAGFLSITGGDPNIRTELRNQGTITHGNAYLDLDAATGLIRVLSGGVYETVNTSGDFGIRQFNGGQGLSIEVGGKFRHNSPNGARFLVNAGNAPGFNVTGGMLEVLNGTLGINTSGQFSDVTITVADGASLNFLSGSSITVKGLITGIGEGKVRLTESGTFNVDPAGATLNFTSGQFEWGAAGSIGGTGILNNVGHISLAGGDPNLRTELRNFGTITHGNNYLDFDAAGAKLRVMPGGTYVTTNTAGDYGFRQFNGGFGVIVEGNGIFRHQSPNGARFLSNAGNNPSFSVNGGTVDVVSGTLGMNGSGTFTDAVINVAAGAEFQVISGANITVQGTLTGQGGGVFNLTQSGVLTIPSEGATIDFPENYFLWTGAATITGSGVLLNTGFVHINGGDPNLQIQMRSSGTITQGNSYLDFDAAGASLRILDGGLFKTMNTASDYGFRQFNGGQGIFVQGGGIFRHDSPNSARFLTNAGNNPVFSVDGGRVEVLHGTLGMNGQGLLNNAVLEISTGANFNFLSGANTALSGTVIGTGGGAVNLTESGFLNVNVGGATIDFAPGLFNWVAAGTIGGVGVLTNAGTINISSGDPNLQTELKNLGTIRHGNAYLDFDAASGKVTIQNGGRYITENTASDYGFRQFNGGQGVFIEAGGLYQHNSPNGARFLTNAGNSPTFSNLGTAEVLKGTFFLNGNTPQFAGGVLSGGAWEAKPGATLSFNNANITGLGAGTTLILNGTGAITGSGSLTQNAGALRLLGGADFTTSGTFTNTGTLTLSPGSIFTAGAFTQSAAGSLEFQVGGSAAAQSGKLVVTSAATLDGTARIAVVGGFGAVAGQSATLMTYANKTGAFANIEGLSIAGVPYFEATTGLTSFKVTAIRDAADLTAEAISGPATGYLGQPVTFTFTVRNVKDVPTLTSSWTDAVYLSKDGLFDVGDVRIGGVLHNGTLTAGGSYTSTLTASLPALVPGDYQILVVVDDLFQVPDSDRFNNAIAGASDITTDLEHITHGVAEITTISSGQSLYYQIDAPAGRDILLTGTLGIVGAAKFYAKLNGIPTSSDFDVSATSVTELQQKLALFGTSALPFLLLVEGTDAAGNGAGISISTRDLGFEIVGTSPATIPNVATQQVTISGSHFTAGTTVRLVDPFGNEIVPTSVVLQNSNTLVAQFSAGTLKPGLFDVRLSDGGAVSEAVDVVKVVPAQATHSGTISASEHWFGGLVHYVTSTVTVNPGVTLTIDPGAIIKFAPFTGIQVNGSIIADGTLAEPIVFTSFKDDLRGGDTNSDGIATTPLAGDWSTIVVNGTGVFDHAQLLYGGGSPSGSWSATAALRTSSGTLSFTNSEIKDAFFDGLLAWGGTVTVENSIFARIDRAISAHPGSPVTVKNSTFDDNRIALLIHGGSLDVSNSIIYNSIQHGILFDYGSPTLGIRNSDIYSTVPGSATVGNLPNPIGSNGNISADPKLKNPAVGDYRLNYLSPAIDSANGAFAPGTDARDLARYDDPRVANSGSGAPAFADMGALEFVENAPSPLDLIVTSVIGTPVVTGGATARVTWTLQNIGTDVVRGAWHDTLQLVSNDGTVVLDAGTFLTSATLSAGQTATFAADVNVPYGTEGQYHWQVKANSAGEVFEGPNTSNNTRLSSAATELHVPELILGSTVTGAFSNIGQGVLYKVHPDSGTDLRIQLTRADGGLTNLSLGLNAAPTAETYLARRASAPSNDATIGVTNTYAQEYYLFIAPGTLPAGTTNFSLTATSAGFGLSSIGVNEGGTGGRVTVPISGSGFNAALNAAIIAIDGTTIPALSVRVEDGTHAFATFDLKDQDPGAYDVRVTQGTQSAQLDDAFHVVSNAVPGTLQINVLLPQKVRAGRDFTAYVEYTNVGDTDLISPLIRISSTTGNEMRLDADGEYTATLDVLAVAQDGAAGILRPGDTARLPILVKGKPGTNNVSTSWADASNTLVYDWSGLQLELQEGFNHAPDFAGVFNTIRNGGTTIGDYVKVLSQAATLHADREGAPSFDPMDNLVELIADRLADLRSTLVAHTYFLDAAHPMGEVNVAAVRVSDNVVVGLATSTADGLVRFENLAPGTYRLETFDYLTASAPTVVVPTTGKLDAGNLILRDGGTISGRIIAGPGEDFSDEAVSVTGADGRQYDANVEADGSFHAHGLPTGTYQVQFASPNLILDTYSGIQVTEGHVTFLGDTVESSQGSIAGIVKNAGGTPLANVAVTVRDASGNTHTAITASDGTYLLKSISPGTRLLIAGADGLIPQQQGGIVVTSGNTTSGVNFTLAPAGTVSGVVTIGGVPAAQAAVTLKNSSGDIVALTVANNAGAYSFPNLAPGDYTVESDYWKADIESAAASIAGGGSAVANIDLDHKALIAGTLTDTAGHPLKGVTMFLILPGGDLQVTSSDASGNYSFSRLAEIGTYTVLFGDGSHRTAVNIAGPASEGDVDYNIPVGLIVGKLTNAAGTAPVIGTVNLIKDGQVIATAVTTPTGEYAIPTVTAGTYTVAASSDSAAFAAQNVTVVAGQTLANTNFQAGKSSLSAQFVDSAGQPVTGGVAYLQRVDLPDDQFAVFTAPNGDAAIDFGSLAPGQYLLYFRAEGKAAVQQIVTITAGANDLTVTVGEPSTLSGVIRDPSGTPLGGVTVQIYQPGSPKLFRDVVTGADGSYALPEIAAGSYSMIVLDSRETPAFGGIAITGVSLVAGGSTIQNAQFSSTVGGVSGKIAAANLESPAAAIVKVVNADGVTVASTLTDLDGQYSLSTLSPGNYTIKAEAKGFVVQSANVTVTAGQTVSGANLSAQWFVDPPSPNDADPSWGQWLGNLPEQINDFFGKLVGERPVDNAPFFPPPSIPKCCDEALALYKERLRWQQIKQVKFDIWHERWQAAADVIRNDAGEFIFNAVKFASNFISAGTAIAGSAANGLLSKLSEQRKGLVTDFFEAGRLPLEEARNYQKAILEMEKFEVVVRNWFEGGVGLPGNLINTQTAIEGGGLTSGAAVLEKLFNIGSWTGRADLIDFATTAAGAAGDLAQILSTAAQLTELFQGIAPELSGILGKISDGMGALKSALQGINDAFNESKELAALQDSYNKAVQKMVDAQRALEQALANCATKPPCDDPPKPPKPDDDKNHDGDDDDSDGVGSFDPNDKLTIGHGSEGFITAGTLLPYTVRFENVANASAAAQLVTVTDQLSTNLDWMTVELGDIGFNGVVIDVPAGLTHYEANVSVSTDPFPVHVVGHFNAATGLLTWTISSIDPVTGQLPEDPEAGFLPPNNAQDQGEGFVSYSVKPLSALANGTAIHNQARIVFDVNAPIDTPLVTNTIDSVSPTSSVTAQPANQPNASFLVSWSGTDNAAGSGVASYDIYVSDNGNAYQPFVLGTSGTSANFTGEPGHTYRFYSVATDNVGNVEAAPGIADTLTSGGTFESVTGKTFTDFDGDKFLIKISGGGDAQVILAPDGHIALLKLTDTTVKTTVSINVKSGGGDGKVELGGVLGEGSLKGFAAPKAFLTTAGFMLGGSVGSLALGDVLDGVDITFGGDATKKVSIALGTVSDGSRITTGSQISTLAVADYGDGRITAAALGKLTTKTGAFDADMRITGAVGAVTVKTSVNPGKWIASDFGAISVGGGAFAADIEATGGVAKLTVKSGEVSGNLTAGSFGAISITGGSFTGQITATKTTAQLAKKPGLAGITVAGGNITGDIQAQGPVGTVTAKADKSGNGGGISGDLSGASFGKIALAGGDLTGSITSTATLAELGKVMAIAGLTISGGNASGDITLGGKAGAVAVSASKTRAGGALSGDLIGAAFGKIALKGGDFSGSITSLTSAVNLGKTPALAALSVAGGDITGDVRVAGDLGALTVSASKSGSGGNIDGATITARKIASITAAKNVTNSYLLSGADLGANGAFGGGDDTFGAGSIGAVTVKGDVVASVIAAGLSNPNAILKDLDDAIVAADAAQKLTNSIAKLLIAGAADSTSYFAAASYGAKPKISDAVVTPSSDSRFLS